MSRDGDSGSMASRRREWYHTHRRHLLDEESNLTGTETECVDSEFEEAVMRAETRCPESQELVFNRQGILAVLSMLRETKQFFRKEYSPFKKVSGAPITDVREAWHETRD